MAKQTTGTNLFTKYTSTVEVALTNKSGQAALITCAAASLPTDAGYAIGCIAIANDTGLLYYNTGTTSIASFTAVNAGAAALTLPSALGDAATTTGASFAITPSAITTGIVFKAVNGNTTNYTTGAALFYGDLGTATAGNGLVITGTGAYTGTGLAVLNTGAMTTGIGLSVISTTGLTTGSLIRATSSTAGVLATNGAISFTATGAFTSTSAVNGGFVEIKANSTTAGTITNIVGTALTTGVALNISNGTSGITTGSLLKVTASGTGAIATNGVVSLSHAGIYTSTSNAGFVNITANATTAGTVLAVNATGLVDGIGIYSPSAEAGLTTGKYMSLGGGKFTIAKFGATVIAGSASGTAALTLTAGDVLLTSGGITLSANSSVISFTGTGTNGGILTNLYNDTASALSGTQKDIKIMIGATAYYFTVYPTKA